MSDFGKHINSLPLEVFHRELKRFSFESKIKSFGNPAVLRNPPPPYPIWNLVLEGEHPAYRLEYHDDLTEK